MRAPYFILLFTSALCASAQSFQKIGFAEPNYILSQLPEFKKLDSELKTHYNQLQDQLKIKSDELQTKLKTFKTLPASTPDVIKADKERELATLQQSLEKFKEDAQTSYQKKQSDLISPVYKKVGTAIDEVARENGYAFILNAEPGSDWQTMLVRDERFNISDLVLKKMGVVPAPRTSLKID